MGTGGILRKDGSAWNYGHLQDPSMPEFNYVKEADYISGASIMIRAKLWKQLGGFDETFSTSLIPPCCSRWARRWSITLPKAMTSAAAKRDNGATRGSRCRRTLIFGKPGGYNGHF